MSNVTQLSARRPNAAPVTQHPERSCWNCGHRRGGLFMTCNRFAGVPCMTIMNNLLCGPGGDFHHWTMRPGLVRRFYRWLF